MEALCQVREADREEEVAALFPVMQQLRPQLASASDLVAYWRTQVPQCYALLGLWVHGQPRALAGYRLQENLALGRFLYVDDLVTDDQCRGQGFGEQLMLHLQHIAREQQCHKLVLDTPMSNALGHRFYFRCGLLATSLRFNMPMLNT